MKLKEILKSIIDIPLELELVGIELKNGVYVITLWDDNKKLFEGYRILDDIKLGSITK